MDHDDPCGKCNNCRAHDATTKARLARLSGEDQPVSRDHYPEIQWDLTTVPFTMWWNTN